MLYYWFEKLRICEVRIQIRNIKTWIFCTIGVPAPYSITQETHLSCTHMFCTGRTVPVPLKLLPTFRLICFLAAGSTRSRSGTDSDSLSVRLRRVKDSRAILISLSLSLSPHCISFTKKSHSRRKTTVHSHKSITAHHHLQAAHTTCLSSARIWNFKKIGKSLEIREGVLIRLWSVRGGRFTICLHITLADFFLGRVGSLLHFSLVFLAQLLAVTLGVPASKGPIAS